MKVSMKTAISFGMGSLGQNMLYTLTVSYLLMFYTDYLGIAAASAGVLLLVVRVIDAFADPLFGIFMDNTHTRWGKFRPYLLFTPVVLTVLTLFLFMQPNLSDHGKLIYAFVTYAVWSIAYTFLDVPYWSMTAVITDDPRQRTKVVVVPRIMAIIGAIVSSALTIPLVKATGSWTVPALLFSGVCMLCMWLTFFTVKEKIHTPRKETFKIAAAWTLLRSNVPLLMLLLSLFIVDMTMNLRSAFSIYYFKYVLHKENLIALYTAVSIVPILAGAFLSIVVMKKIGKRNTAVVGNIGFGLSYILLFLFGHGVTMLFVWSILGTLMIGMSLIAMSSMLADTVEYGEWRTGDRAEATIFSTNTFRSKFADAMGGSLGAFALAMTGYVPNQAQSPGTVTSIGLFFSVIPGVLMILAALPFLKYKLTEPFYDQILIDIKLRRTAADKSRFDEGEGGVIGA
ncbi:glycoside-pentoside-hexuronide (GPH):cation symporter [Paenibacillus sp. FSL H3-0457]|uniref:MFS transporter n=2 Tax=unclassified Paenibacillus TaxID=185978 RepID=UPI0030ED8C37